MTAVRSLYLHIPFCERKCGYCDFVSVAGTEGEDAYMGALHDELSRLAAALPPISLDTIFIGGGTPSLVEPHRIGALLDHVSALMTVGDGCEITMEANPSSVDAGRLGVWLAAGVNRVSLGIQSLDAGTLEFLGRVHDAAAALRALRLLRSSQLASVSCDLIYAVPGLSDAAWGDTVGAVLAEAPDHVSCYELTVESGTQLHERVAQGRTTMPQAEAALAQHWQAVDLLEGGGWRQYEVSNFAQPGHTCEHNLTYWRGRHYLAAGVGAHGFLPPEMAAAVGRSAEGRSPGVRYWHRRGIRRYVDDVRAGGLGVEAAETISAVQAGEERLMLGLRTSEGVLLPPVASQVAAGLVEAGLLVERQGRHHATRRGQEVLNAVVERLTVSV
jgi:putative oxygen-independent coproporphyrinogen III oxidase